MSEVAEVEAVPSEAAHPPQHEPGGVLGELATDLTLLSPQQVDEQVERIAKAANAFRRLKIAAMRFTQPHDWIDMGGKPYLEGEGALRLCAIGISIEALRPDDFDVTEENGQYYVECMVTASWPRFGKVHTEIGACNTLDKFYTKGGEKSQLGQLLALAQHDDRVARRALLGHVKKKAYMNGISRAVTGLMGIRGLTFDDLAQADVSTEKAGARVAFDGGKAGVQQASSASSRPPAPPSDAAPLAMRAESIQQAPIGTVASLTGVVVSAEQKHPKFYIARVQDGAVTLDLKVWAAEIPDHLWQGQRVVVPAIKISEYRNKRQYTAEEGIEPDEPESNAGSGNGATGPPDAH